MAATIEPTGQSDVKRASRLRAPLEESQQVTQTLDAARRRMLKQLRAFKAANLGALRAPQMTQAWQKFLGRLEGRLEGSRDLETTIEKIGSLDDEL